MGITEHCSEGWDTGVCQMETETKGSPSSGGGEALCRAVKRHDINTEQSHRSGVSRRERYIRTGSEA